MKRIIPYVLIAMILIAGIGLLFTSAEDEKRFDERLSFKRRDKVPYGMYVAYEQLKNFFPNATITTEKSEPGMWDNLSAYDEKQALIVISPQFMPNEIEMKRLISFVERGNDVFISTSFISWDARKLLGCDVSFSGDPRKDITEDDDSLIVSIAPHPANESGIYSYPGRAHDVVFTKMDSTISMVLGYDRYGSPNFLRFAAGSGNIYLHTAPLAFSNYFLLHRNNINYYENVFSFLSNDKKKIAWDEYYIYRQQRKQSNRTSWMTAFMNEKGFRWGLLVAVTGLLIYALMEMRRKQRIIPVIAKPRNDSLDFVKTIGRLYHDKGDHYNLCRKMSAYFLEHVRTRYKLNTSELNEDFISSLQYKSGVSETEIRPIVEFIRALDNGSYVDPKQLIIFHKQLESFYKKA